MLAGVLVMGAGAFSILGGVMNWDWYMNNRRARLITAIVGRTGARIFYVALGAAFMVGGVLFMVNGPGA
jgi:hypothetical protein